MNGSAARRRSNDEWLASLSQAGLQRDQALRDLRAVLITGLQRGLVGRNTGAEAFIEDFAQEALVKILGRIESFRGESQFTTWAVAIAMRVAFAELRRLRWRDVSLDDAIDSGTPHAARIEDTTDLPDVQAARNEISALVRRLIDDALTARQREAILAELGGDMPLEAIARKMGSTRNALYKLMHDARKHLKKEILATGLTADAIRKAFNL